MIDYYPGFSTLSPTAKRNGNDLERRALQNAAVFVAVSDWARQGAMTHYGIADHKIAVIPRPPNFDAPPSRETALAPRNRAVCRLFFSGMEWQRKGGNEAVEVVNEMNNAGLPAELWVCGCAVPRRFKANPHVKACGFLDPGTQSGMDRLDRMLRDSHFLILLSHAECQGQVLSEAAAYGLPLIVTRTGGVGVVAKEEFSILSAPGTPPREIAERISALWRNPAAYDAMRIAARDFFEARLSEDAWAEAMRKVLQKTTVR